MAREELRSKLGVPAASFPAVVRGLVEDGRIVEDWVMVETLGFYQQLGLIPSMQELLSERAAKKT